MNQELAMQAVCLETSEQKLEGRAKGEDSGSQTWSLEAWHRGLMFC